MYGVHTTLGIIGAEVPYPIRSVSDVDWKLIRNLNAEARFSNIIMTDRDDELVNAWQKAGWDNMNKSYRKNYNYKRPAVELDLRAAPYEMHNLAGDRNYDEISNIYRRSWTSG